MQDVWKRRDMHAKFLVRKPVGGRLSRRHRPRQEVNIKVTLYLSHVTMQLLTCVDVSVSD
jgi:hypothetical protein